MHGLFKPKRNIPRRPRHRNRGGQQLAAIRGFAGAHLVRGEPIPPPTISQAATMCGTSTTYIECALVVLQAEDSDLVRRVRRGDISLANAAKAVAKRAKIVAAIRAASPEDLVEAAKTVGIAKVFDEMICPAL